jgi:hypothetical protein
MYPFEDRRRQCPPFAFEKFALRPLPFERGVIMAWLKKEKHNSDLHLHPSGSTSISASIQP